MKGTNKSAPNTVQNDEQPAANNVIKSAAARIAEFVGEIDLFRDFDDVGYAAISVEGHTEAYAIRSRRFERWVQRQYYLHFGTVLASQSVKDAVSLIEAKAVHEGEQKRVFLRVGGDRHRIAVDVGDSNWSAIVVDGDGWRLVSESPVVFRRPSGQKQLPVPVKTNEGPEVFKDLINVTEEDLPLLIGWMLASFRPTGPYPILFVHGEQGSSKSTTSRVCRRLIDPNRADLRASPRNERDLMVQANNSWLIALENLSSIQPWLSDALCRIATGGGFSTRQLFTDGDETIINVQRSILINGIEDLAERSDLIDRSFVINLPRIPDSCRRTEASFWRDFDENAGVMLGCLLNGLSTAIKNFDLVELQDPPRMADAAKWIVSAESVFGWNGEFMTSFGGHKDRSNQSAIEASVIGPALVGLLNDVGEFLGTASELIETLDQRADETERRRREKTKAWPKNGRKMSSMLRRLAPNMRTAGYECESDLPGRRFRIAMGVQSANGSNGSNGLLQPDSPEQPTGGNCTGHGLPIDGYGLTEASESSNAIGTEMI